MKNDYPLVSLLGKSGQITNPSHHKTSPSHISILGTLTSGATASITYRTTSPSVESIGLRWLITGTEGELEITTPESQWQSAPTEEITLKARFRQGSQTQDEDFMAKEWEGIAELTSSARNTARLYESFASGDREQYPDFREALEVTRVFDWIREEAGEEWKIKV